MLELGRGTEQEAAERTRFVQTITQVTAQLQPAGRRRGVADLRHGDGYAVRLRGVTTAAETPAKAK